MMCLTNAVLVAMGLVSKFSKYKGTLTSPQFLHAAVYGIMAAVQLAVLLLQRQVYLRYRFKVRHAYTGGVLQRKTMQLIRVAARAHQGCAGLLACVLL